MRTPTIKRLTVLVLALLAFTSVVLAQNSAPVFGMLGVIQSDPSGAFTNLFVTPGGSSYAIVGQNVAVEQQIAGLRQRQPPVQVQVWGTLYYDVSGDFDQIVASEILELGDTSGDPQAVVATDVLNVRSGPSTAYPVIGQAKRGEIYDIVGKSSASRPWYLICCLPQNKQGWVSGDLVNTFGDLSQVKIVTVAPPPTPKPTPVPTTAPKPTPVPPPPQPPTDQWLATYFNDIHLSGAPLAQRIENSERYKLSRNWGLDSPIPGVVPADNWSGRWVGRWYFQGGDQYFELKSEDGGKLYLDSILVIDQWRDGENWNNNIFRSLGEGYHTVTIDYYERGGLAWLEANWYKVNPGGYQPP